MKARSRSLWLLVCSLVSGCGGNLTLSATHPGAAPDQPIGAMRERSGSPMAEAPGTSEPASALANRAARHPLDLLLGHNQIGPRVEWLSLTVERVRACPVEGDAEGDVEGADEGGVEGAGAGEDPEGGCLTVWTGSAPLTFERGSPVSAPLEGAGHLPPGTYDRFELDLAEDWSVTAHTVIAGTIYFTSPDGVRARSGTEPPFGYGPLSGTFIDAAGTGLRRAVAPLTAPLEIRDGDEPSLQLVFDPSRSGRFDTGSLTFRLYPLSVQAMDASVGGVLSESYTVADANISAVGEESRSTYLTLLLSEAGAFLGGWVRDDGFDVPAGSSGPLAVPSGMHPSLSALTCDVDCVLETRAIPGVVLDGSAPGQPPSHVTGFRRVPFETGVYEATLTRNGQSVPLWVHRLRR